MSNTITVNVVTSVSTGPASGYFIIDGDFTSLFFPGFKFILSNPPFQNLHYTTVSSVLSAGQTQVTVASAVYGSIVAINNITPVAGPFVSGTYTPVILTGGTGSGALATVVNIGPGSLHALGAITGGSGYNNGTYTAVPLTGGTGSGAQATVQVTGGFVTNVVITNNGTGYSVTGPGSIHALGAITGGSGYTSGTYTAVPLTGGTGSGALATVTIVGGIVTNVVITNSGIGYSINDTLSASNANFGGVGGGFSVLVTLVGDTLSASNTNLGGVGAGFSIPVLSVNGTLLSVTIINSGVAYTAGNTLTFSGPEVGTGTVDVVTVTTTEIGTITIQNNQPMFTVGQNVYVINNANSACQIPWWAWTPQVAGIPAVESGQILEAIVDYTNAYNSPTITYSVRIGTQPGVVLLDQSVVFIDKPTAITAYQAMNL